MSDILVYNKSSRKFGVIEGDQLSFSILKASYVYDIKEFSLLLSQRPYKLVFIVCDEAIEPDTIRFIKACKNVSFQRDASLFVFFFQQNYSGVRQALLAGACQIYLDPVPWRRIREDMLRALNPDETGRTFRRSSPSEQLLRRYRFTEDWERSIVDRNSLGGPWKAMLVFQWEKK